MHFVVCCISFFLLVSFSVDSNDKAAHEYSLNSGRLHEVSRIPFNSLLWRIIFDVDSDILLVRDENDAVQMGTRNGNEWKVTELKRSDIEHIDIECWTRMGMNRVGLYDWNSDSMKVYEYE